MRGGPCPRRPPGGAGDAGGAAGRRRTSCAEAADEVVVLETPEQFFAIGQWYDDFTQTPDREVTDLLERAADR